MSDTPPASIVWRTSSASAGGNCVEVAFTSKAVLVRDSKDRGAGTLSFPSPVWENFMTAIRNGVYDVK
jgi:hypothetical protein